MTDIKNAWIVERIDFGDEGETKTEELAAYPACDVIEFNQKPLDLESQFDIGELRAIAYKNRWTDMHPQDPVIVRFGYREPFWLDKGDDPRKEIFLKCRYDHRVVETK